mgnify:CR=1 FL=1|tara:strand:- start:2644 stop:4473 length:1830 start_codon:yes stop_codon:yes gene_type:complete
MVLINGHKQLSYFRASWTGEKMLELLSKNEGRLRIDWPIGVGKSHSIDKIIETAITTDRYDFVIALFPTRQIIKERTWITAPPLKIKIINLKPRPYKKCGPEGNASWKAFEKNNLGALGRIELCGSCQKRNNCYWPKQYGKSLRGTKVVLGTQAHLERSPDFILQLTQWAKAKRVLVILDEANFVMKTFQRRIERRQIIFFIEVLKKQNSKYSKQIHKRWLYLSELLLQASTNDFRCNEWRTPGIPFKWAGLVQKLGYNMFGDDFKFIAYDLSHFSRSKYGSREQAENGDILFAATPNIAGDFIIFSGSVDHGFSQFRFGREFSSPFKSYCFKNPGTHFYNIASRLSAKKYFKKNSSQILDFFAGLVVTRLKEGKRPLLISKKCFINHCIKEMKKRLKVLGFRQIRIITKGWKKNILANPFVIPLINYGEIGTNLFQEFDCAYCLTGYYVPENAVNGILNDVLASDFKLPISLTFEGRPCRRKAGVLNSTDRIYDVHRLAQPALDHLEMGTVFQAVGRVRPYTKPREIITFQCAEHPNLGYSREFNNITEAREYFNIKSSRTLGMNATKKKVQAAKEKGLTQKESAKKFEIGLRTVKRYWNAKRCHQLL